MFDSQVMAFTLVAAVLAVTPGADTMLVLKNGMRHGAAAGWATTFGVLAGTLVHAGISALGISLIVTQSETLFYLLKSLGAVYLIWLGIQSWRMADRSLPVLDSPPANRASAFAEGLLTNVLNPKVAVFYIAFLPQFISPDDSVLGKSLLLAMIHNLLSLIWLGSLVVLLARGTSWFEQPVVRARLSRLAGVLLVGFGMRLALESR